MISIITPTYNRAHLLTRLFKSLERQTCKDFEWIVIDDGSTDNTKLLVNSILYSIEGGVKSGISIKRTVVNTLQSILAFKEPRAI